MDDSGITSAAAWEELDKTNPILSIRGAPPTEFDRVVKLVFKKLINPREIWRDIFLPWSLESLEFFSIDALKSFRKFRRQQAQEQYINKKYYTEASTWTLNIVKELKLRHKMHHGTPQTVTDEEDENVWFRAKPRMPVRKFHNRRRQEIGTSNSGWSQPHQHGEEGEGNSE